VSTSFDRDLSMSVSRPEAGSCVVSLSGDLDIDSAAEFGTSLDAMTAAAELHVIVELSGVRFIDSSGLNSLVVGARETGRRGGSFVVAAPSQYVARVFDLVRIGESIRVVGSVDDALAASGAAREQVDS
jgi:anti-anti-sigma factor